MARSFLFAQDEGDAATTRLIATAAATTGFMKGEPGAARPGWYEPGGDNHRFLGELHNALATTYPDAGAPLWAVRLWTNLIWQPAYLAVVAVHMHGAVPVLAGMSQGRRGIYVDGYRLVPGEQSRGDMEALLIDAAAQLKTMADAMLVEVNAHERLRPLPARRLLADRMLSLMVWLGQRRPELKQGEILDFAAAWLEALGLTGQGTLEVVGAGARSVVIVKRKGCCLDYLFDPERLCASCPKQSETVRRERQVRNALAELG